MNWQRHLLAGEELIWLGRPDGRVQPGRGIVLTRRGRFLLTAAVLWSLALLLLVIGPRLAGSWVVLAILAAVALAMLFWLWSFLWGWQRLRAFWRRRTYYALTNLRALTAVHSLGRDWVWAYKLRREDKIFWDGKSPGTVIYNRYTVDYTHVRRMFRRGFYLIQEGARVKALIERAQRRLPAAGR